MQVSRAREFSVYLHDRPGELAGVLEALAAAGTAPTALAVAEHNGRGLVRLIAAEESRARRVVEGLSDAGAGPIAEAEVLLVEAGEDAAFREIAIRLADEGVNVRYAYRAGGNGSAPQFVVRTDDLEAAERSLLNGARPPDPA